MNIVPTLPNTAALTGSFAISPEAGVPREIPSPVLQQAGLPTSTQASASVSSASFDDVLGRMVGEVNQRQIVAADKAQGLLSGQDVSLHETMIALEEASVSFQLMVEVRNKLLESYQELMRMQV